MKTDSEKTIILKTLIKVICYPTTFTKKYMNSLYNFILDNFPYIEEDVITNGVCVTLWLYVYEITSAVKIIKPLLVKLQSLGLYCCIKTVDEEDKESYLINFPDRFHPDDNDYIILNKKYYD